MADTPTLIRSTHPKAPTRDKRMYRRLDGHIYPARMQLQLLIIGNDGHPRQYDRWNIEALTPGAVKQVKAYINQAVKQLNGKVVGPDEPAAE